MNPANTKSQKQHLLNSIRKVFSEIRSLVIVFSEVEIDSLEVDVIEFYFDAVNYLSQQAENYCAQLKEVHSSETTLAPTI